jgi:hypothetical protein
MPSSGMLRPVARVRTDVSEEEVSLYSIQTSSWKTLYLSVMLRDKVAVYDFRFSRW